MPQYDESFFLDDTINQRRNKRSYRVYKKGIYPTENIKAISNGFNNGTYAAKVNNLQKCKKDFGSIAALGDIPSPEKLYPKAVNKSFPSLLDGDYVDKYILSRSTSTLKNYSNDCCGGGKSLEDLLSKKGYSKSSLGFLATKVRSKESQINYYAVNTEPIVPVVNKSKRIYESNRKHRDRSEARSKKTLESGSYRRLDTAEDNEDSGFIDDTNGSDCEGSGPVSGSGHKPSFRGANKLARRARSFKEDFLERITAMALRSPAHHPLSSHNNRSHSPLSPKIRGQNKTEDSESNPAKELEVLVRQVRFDLKHFSDVISKNKLEMLPGNGTILLDTITNIHTAIRPHVSPLGANPSASLASALSRLCQAVAQLIRLCDEAMLDGENSAALHRRNVEQVTGDVQQAVEDLAVIAFEKMTSQPKSNGTVPSADSKNLKLQIRPAVDGIRNSSNESQRNSLPDIPLTPRERLILEGSGGGLVVRSSHSTESILDTITTPSHQEPPPKPPRPMRGLDIAPPLPPKKKITDNNSLQPQSAIDRVSLQSHSSGSLDSMLNVSNDEEIKAIMDRSSVNLDDSIQHTAAGICSCLADNAENRLSLESNSTVNRLSNEMMPYNNRFSNETTTSHNVNQNRFSNESGFVSMGGNVRCSEVSNISFKSLSTHQQQKSSLSFIDATPTPGDMPLSVLTESFHIEDKASKIPSPPPKPSILSMASVVEQSMRQTSTTTNVIENKMVKAFSHSSSITEHQFKSAKTESHGFAQSIDSSKQLFLENGTVTDDDVDASNSKPPALPVKTRKQIGKLLNQKDTLHETSFDDQTIEFRDHNKCMLHGHDTLMQRPHTLMDQSLSSGQPPPLPLKKKHMFQSVAYSVMAYMEMFGNCNHSNQNSTEFMRHSVHAYNAVQQHLHHQQHGASHFQMSSSQLQQLANMSMGPDGFTAFNHSNGQVTHALAHNGQLGTFNQHQIQQSQTMHHISMSSTNSMNSKNLSAFSSPLRSPRHSGEESIKSDTSLTPTIPTVSGNVSPQLPPALPPKKTKMRQSTPTQSPAKPPLSPKPASILISASNSPSTPAPTLSVTPLSGRASISPVPKFQFDPPCSVTEDSLLLNVEQDDSWQQHSPNKPGKFPLDDLDVEQRTDASSSPGSRETDAPNENESETEPDIILEMDVSNRLVMKRSGEDGPDIRGGNPDALIVQAIKSTKDFSYQEAFLTTYRTFVTPQKLIEKLNKRHTFLSRHGKHTRAREVQSFFTRVVGDFTTTELDSEMLQLVMDFVYGLVGSGDLAMAKVLRVIILDKYRNKVHQEQQAAYLGWTLSVSARRDSILEQKAESVAEQMTLLDAELFTRIPPPEALLWARDQCEERSPNLTRFTEHFNKMSYWARSRILEQEDARDREKYVMKFIKVMKYLRKMNNFNSYLALLSALDSAPIRRLEWQKHITDGLKEYCALIDSSSSFRAYRQALAETQPPCIPYIGLVLQDLTFVHIGNSDLLPDGSINFSKRWQQYHILENMKRFSKAQYTFKKNERIIAMFNGFDDVLNEEAMWQISESIKPRGGKKTVTT